MNSVRGGFAFWAEVDELPDGDPIRDELYSIFFDLVENGPLIEGVKLARWSFGDRWVNGYSIALKDGTGFVGYVAVYDVHGEPFIALLHLVWYE